MLCVKTKKLLSPIHGIGLFADQDIPSGSVIWQFVSGFDQVFTLEGLRQLPPEAQIFLARYAYMSKKSHRYILDADDARYFNHSADPNSSTKESVHSSEHVITAVRDIKATEEITINYADQEDDLSKSNLLASFYDTYNLNDEIDPRLKKNM